MLRTPGLRSRRGTARPPLPPPAWPPEVEAEFLAGKLTPVEVLDRLYQRAVQPPVPLVATTAASPTPGATNRPAMPPIDEAALRATQRELAALIGLVRVKAQVEEIIALARVNRWRAQAELATEAQSLHMLFTGHPGTGKTTVARILGRTLHALGLLPKGHLVEVERADLVGEYIGHTALKTREVMRKALGGVLFIDEAYSLARGGEKDFGKEAIDCLVRGMEEHRAELIVILAGYPVEMRTFLEQNPGLHSRFPTQIDFPDYDAADLLAIADTMLAQRQYTLAPAARAYLQQTLGDGRYRAEAGNARAVRNLLERSARCHALRLAGGASPTTAAPTRLELMELTRADLEAALRWH